MAGIFISYRRDDTQGWAGRLARAVQESFPKTQVFYDIATLQPGEDFPAAIDRALSSCQSALVLIGTRWLSAQTAEGQRRIDNPNDFVRLEIAAALARPILIVPVLLGGAGMPKAESLPDVLQPLAHKQGHEISDKRWDYDCDLLLHTLGEALGVRPLRSNRQEGAAPGEGISVGRGLTITNSRVGDIVGVKLSGGKGVAAPGLIDVARDARIQDAEVGDIAGLKVREKKGKKEKKQRRTDSQ
jgi:TIR domain